MAKRKMKFPVGLVVLGVGAYLLLRPKTAAAQVQAPAWAPPDFTPTGTGAGYDTSVAIPYRPSWQ